jgi:hypothetical protein
VAPAVVAAVLLASSGEPQAKPLFGFERDAVAAIEKLEVDTPAAYAIHNSFAGRTGDATEGRWALVRTLVNRYGFLAPGNRTTYYNYHRIGCLLNTHGWFTKAMPQDWSGFAAFRVDVKSDSADLVMLLELEDAVIPDPVTRRYTAPAGKWVALEVDLAEAAQRLGLDLKHVAGLRLIATEMSTGVQSTAVRVDNLRLVAAGAPDRLPVLRDTTPMALPLRRPGLITPLDPVDVSMTKPLSGEVGVIDLAGDPKWRRPDYPLFMVKERLLGGFGGSGVLLVTGGNVARLSLDGGVTWQGLDGRPTPTRLLTDIRGHRATVLVDGRDLYVACVPDHCAGGSGRTELFFTRALYRDGRWTVGPQVVFETGLRHCADRLSLVKQKTGRLWVGWDHLGVSGTYSIHAKFSDDTGLTWKDGGRNGLVGEEGSGIPTGPYLAEYGDGVVCVWRQKETLLWSRTEGDRWTPPQRIRGRELPMSVVAAGDSLYVAVTRPDAVLRFDGKVWTEDSPPVRTGLLTRWGGDVVCVARRPSERGTEIVFCRRGASGWSAPQVAAVETEAIEDLAVQQIAGDPGSFLPIAWTSTTRRWIKVLAVPVGSDAAKRPFVAPP